MSLNNVLPQEREPLLRSLIESGQVNFVTLDCESAPRLAYVWGTGEQYVSEKQMKTHTKIIMVQYLKEGDKGAKYLEWDWHGADGGDDSSLLEELITNILSLPNLIILGQNTDKFDLPLINDRAVKLGLSPIPFNQILKVDTLKLSRSSFKRGSHSLDTRSKDYGFGGKLPLEFEDWIKTTEGDKKALKKMAEYGLKDPEDTNKMFWRELPYYIKLPAALEKLLREEKAKQEAENNKPYCKACEGKRQKKFEVRVTNNGQIVCLRCGWRS